MLKDEDDPHRGSAAYTLGRMGAKSALKDLVRALDDERGEVKVKAVGALRKLTGQDFGLDQRKWNEWVRRNG
jgi:HEAT repeat protein